MLGVALLVLGLQSGQSLKITELKGEVPTDGGPLLNFKHSIPIAIGNHKQVCFPRRVWALRSRIDVHQLYSVSENWLGTIKDQLRTYKAEGDAGSLIKYFCAATQKNTRGECQDSALTKLEQSDYELKSARSELAFTISIVENRISHISRRILRAPSKVDAIFPPLDNQLIDKLYPFKITDIVRHQGEKMFEVNPPQMIVYLETLDLLVAKNWKGYFEQQELVESNGKYKIMPENKKNISVLLPQWKKTTALLQGFLNVLNSIEFAMEQLNRNLFPVDLFHIDILGEIVDFIRTKEIGMATTKLADVLMLTSIPLTHFAITEMKGDGTCMSDSCIFDIVTFYPIITVEDKFQWAQIFAVPTAHDTYLGSPKWRRIKVPTEGILTRKLGEYFEFEFNKFDKCLPDPYNVACRLCSISESLKEITDSCLTQILEDTKPEACEFQEELNPDEHSMKLDDDEWIYADPSPGQMTENCHTNNVMKSYEMPYSGILRLQNGCSYSFTDSFFKGVTPYIAGVNIVLLTSRKRKSNVKQISEDILAVQIHFRKYGYIYLICIGSISMLLLVVGSWICCVRLKYEVRQRRAYRLRRPRRRGLGRVPEDIPMEPAQNLLRTFPSLPIRDAISLTTSQR